MRKILIALGVVAVLAVVGLAITEYTGSSGNDRKSPAETSAATSAAKTVMPVIGADDFIIGKPGAPITIVEYASLTCPHCARFHTDTLPKLKEKYIEPGKVRLVYRDFPLDKYALQGSMMARCAGRERYLGFIEVMFMTQDSWARADNPTLALARIGLNGGMSRKAFEACMQNKEIETKIIAQRVDAQKKFSINSTPTLIINGQVHAGALTIAEIDKIIAPLLKQP